MVDCARNIVLNSGWNDKITVFDTELIGEGALRTFKEALINLAKPGCRVVPSLGRVWVMPVRSKFLANFNRVPRLLNKECGDAHLQYYTKLMSCLEELNPLGCCPGTSAVFDVQLSQVRQEQFTPLSKPTLAFSFDFELADSLIYNESFDRELECIESGPVDAIMMWLVIHIRSSNVYIFCCFLGGIWIWIEQVLIGLIWHLHGQTSSLRPIDRPYCNCGLHTILARQSIFRLNNLMDDKRLAEELKKPDVILSEPFYLSAMNSWENLRFWYDVSALVKKFMGSIEIWPKDGVLYGISEQFTDLHKIASPVGTVSGFDLSYFDELSQKARQATDALVDEQPLWEYEGILTGKKFEVMKFNMEKEPEDIENRITIPLKQYTNGIPLWMEWQIGDYVITTGLLEPLSGEHNLGWEI
uniref:Type II protein arginine methyltransferase n=1 Tax=Heterorhabditis bacteriophora TaxID=37862 RepID=A0A1I7XQS8_HETBA